MTEGGGQAAKLSYGVKDAAGAIGIGRSTLYEYIDAGEIRTFKLGTRTLILRAELEAFLERHANSQAA